MIYIQLLTEITFSPKVKRGWKSLGAIITSQLLKTIRVPIRHKQKE